MLCCQHMFTSLKYFVARSAWHLPHYYCEKTSEKGMKGKPQTVLFLKLFFCVNFYLPGGNFVDLSHTYLSAGLILSSSTLFFWGSPGFLKILQDHLSIYGLLDFYYILFYFEKFTSFLSYLETEFKVTRISMASQFCLYVTCNCTDYTVSAAS